VIHQKTSLLTNCTTSSESKVNYVFIQSRLAHSCPSEERLRTLEKENRRLSETVYSTMDDIHTWRSSQQAVVRPSTVAMPCLYNLASRLKAAHLPGNHRLSGQTSPLALPRNQRCLILRILHPTILNMISPIGHSPVHRPRTASSTMCHLLLSFPHCHDRPGRRVRITSPRASRLAWRTLHGKSCRLP
jgi:hypothetical protein